MRCQQLLQFGVTNEWGALCPLFGRKSIHRASVRIDGSLYAMLPGGACHSVLLLGWNGVGAGVTVVGMSQRGVVMMMTVWP